MVDNNVCSPLETIHAGNPNRMGFVLPVPLGASSGAFRRAESCGIFASIRAVEHSKKEV
jgi:hypothetical protein